MATGLATAVKILAEAAGSPQGSALDNGMGGDTGCRLQRVVRMVELQEQSRSNALLSPQERERRADEMARHRDLNKVYTLRTCPKTVRLSWIGVGLGYLRREFDSGTRGFSVLTTFHPARFMTMLGISGVELPNR